MLLTLYWFFWAFKVTLTVICVIVPYLIARKKSTPTGTFILFAIGFGFALLSQILTLFNAERIGMQLAEYSILTVVLAQVLASGFYGCCAVGFIRKLSALNSFGIK